MRGQRDLRGGWRRESDPTNRDALVLYARVIGDTADYVLNHVIETTIAKDREFVAWRTEHAVELSALAAPPAPGGSRRTQTARQD